MVEEQQELQRGLKNRHVQLISIGGAIGTGLFLGAGKTIQLAGPSILLAYLITGAVRLPSVVSFFSILDVSMSDVATQEKSLA